MYDLLAIYTALYYYYIIPKITNQNTPGVVEKALLKRCEIKMGGQGPLLSMQNIVMLFQMLKTS